MRLFFYRKKKGETTISAEQEKNLILNESAGFHVKEAYKAARTNIMFSIAEKGCKKIAVTSSFSGEGKSTTCLNLAITFAQTGSKVIVIDADLRKPTIHRKLDVENTKGLAHLLGHFNEIEEVITPTIYENLDVITSGHIPPNPVELLASETMSGILDTLSEKYDYIFIDTPPLNVVTDATVLSKAVSGTVLVVRQGLTHHKDIQDALSKLEFANAKVLGIVLHGIKEKQRSYYGKYSDYGYATDTYVACEQ